MSLISRHIILLYFIVVLCDSYNAQNFLISQGGTHNTCNAVLYDSGGALSNYSDNENYTITFCSNNNDCIRASFVSFDTEANIDELSIFDGPTTGSTIITTLSGVSGGSYTGTTASGGCMTFQFISDFSVNNPGFQANISCVACGTPAPPTEQDCMGAIPVCQNIYTQNVSYSGTGNYPNEINGNSSCLITGEKNDVWYIFTIQQGGDLCFSISPNNLTEDYDWALYNLTNASCEDIYTDPTLEVRCNYDATPGITGANGLAGMQNEACLSVNAGETYVLNVSNFSASQNGYTLDFTASTAQIFDNVDPFIDSVVFCGGDSIEVFFSEYIDCQSVDFTDFEFYVGGVLTPLAGVKGNYCAIGGRFDNPIILQLNQTYGTGNYSVALVDTVYDQCGNVAPLDTIELNFDEECLFDYTLDCAGQISSFSDTSGGKINIWSWDMGDGSTYTQSTISHTYTQSGNYTIQLNFTDTMGCKHDSSFNVYISPQTTADFQYSPTNIGYDVNVTFTDLSAGGSSWIWIFGDGSNATDQNPVYAYSNPGFYDIQLIVNSDSICPDTITKSIEVLGDFICEVPDVFSPNGDNVNDYLTTLIVGLDEMELTIYNRWGNNVYITSDMNHSGWDGKLNGKEQPVGVYYYTITGLNTTTKENIVLKGNISLIR